jgi:integrase/recombinase XerD
VKTHSKAPEGLTKDELKALLRAAKKKSDRDWLMILVAFWHGLRASEVTQFTADAVKDGYITIERLKGSLRTTQALVVHPDPIFNERAPLMKLCADSIGNQPIFGITRQHFWRLVKRYAEAAGIPPHKRHPHILKHTIAQQMIEKAGIHKTRQRLGHKSIQSTGEYLKENDASVDAVVVESTGL